MTGDRERIDMVIENGEMLDTGDFMEVPEDEQLEEDDHLAEEDNEDAFKDMSQVPDGEYYELSTSGDDEPLDPEEDEDEGEAEEVEVDDEEEEMF